MVSITPSMTSTNKPTNTRADVLTSAILARSPRRRELERWSRRGCAKPWRSSSGLLRTFAQVEAAVRGMRTSDVQFGLAHANARSHYLVGFAREIQHVVELVQPHHYRTYARLIRDNRWRDLGLGRALHRKETQRKGDRCECDCANKDRRGCTHAPDGSALTPAARTRTWRERGRGHHFGS